MAGAKEALKRMIKERPQQCITFHDYMDFALYDPLWGYYRQERDKIGKNGDYYTNSSVSPVFAMIMGGFFAKQFNRATGVGQKKIIVEYGGGTGLFAEQVLRHDDGFEWVMVEKSPYHQRLQQERLASFGGRVSWEQGDDRLLARLQTTRGPNAAIGVFANELLDAFPVHQVIRFDNRWWEVNVAWDEEGDGLVERLVECRDKALLKEISAWETPITDGHRIEINLAARSWLQKTAGADWICIVDYGGTEEQLLLPFRKEGTIRGFYRHQLKGPYTHIGEQDLTSHVNFTALMRWAEQLGFKTRLWTQGDFLLEQGILNLLRDHQETDPFRGPGSKMNRAIRQLMMPEAMGETFKVLVLTKT